MARLPALALAAAACCGVATAKPSLRVTDSALTVDLLKDTASSAAKQLLSFYNSTTGFFGPAETIPFWTTANSIETLANYANATGDLALVMPTIQDAHAHAAKRYCDCWRDDHLWYVLAWSRVGVVTGETAFLDTAQAIYNNITAKWQAWNLTCGGIGWEKGNPYVNSITNELFLSASTLLWQLTGNTTLQGNFSYQGWSATEWAWWQSTPLLQTGGPSSGLIIDGLDTHDCSKTTGAVWTYNQGVILSGLTRYAASFNDPAALAYAANLAAAAFKYFGASTGRGDVLVETACGAAGMCGGLDVQQFKGVFVRHMMYALPALGGSPQAVSLQSALLDNAASLLANAAQTDPATGELQFGPLWQGPFQPPGGKPNGFPFVAQGSGLDAVLAALSVLQAREAAGAGAAAA